MAILFAGSILAGYTVWFIGLMKGVESSEHFYLGVGIFFMSSIPLHPLLDLLLAEKSKESDHNPL